MLIAPNAVAVLALERVRDDAAMVAVPESAMTVALEGVRDDAVIVAIPEADKTLPLERIWFGWVGWGGGGGYLRSQSLKPTRHRRWRRPKKT